MSPRTHGGPWLSQIAVGRMISRRTLIQGSAVSLAMLTLPAVPVRAAGEGALVRYVNVAAGAPDLDVYIDRQPVVDALAFGKATKPARQTGGSHELIVQPSGGEQNRPVLRMTLDLDEELRYIIPIFGEFPDVTVQPFAVLVQPLEPETSRLRLFHLAPDLDAIDFGTGDGPTIAEDVRYGGATQYADLDAGTVDFVIRPTGTSDVLLTRADTALEAGRAYDLLVFGKVADDSLRTLLLSATTETADEQTSSTAPSAAEKSYLTSLKETVDLLDQSLVSFDELLQTLETDQSGSLNRLAWVFIGWVLVHQELQAAQAPPRYEALRSAYLAVIEPLAATARQMSNVDDYRKGAATAFNFTALDIGLLLQTVGSVLPQLEAADAAFDAELKEAGIPVD